MIPQRALDFLARIPTVVLDSKVTALSRLAHVHITTATTGIGTPGTVYRMDKIPLPLRATIQSHYPAEVDVIRRIREAVASSPV
jgi:formylmethanofuran dehydrogenase subunit B